MEFQEFTGKTLNDAVTNALIGLETTRENLEYEIVDKGSNGFLGMGAPKVFLPTFSEPWSCRLQLK